MFDHRQCPYCKKAVSQGEAEPSLAAGLSHGQPASGSPSADQETWVLFGKYQNLADADAVVAQLRAGGVAAILPDEFVAQSDPYHIISHGFVRVHVPLSHLERAKLLLAPPAQAPVQDGGATPSAEANLADAPLPWPMRCLALALPLLCACGPGLIIGILVHGNYLKRGCNRMASDLRLYFVLGCVLCGFVVLLIANRR